MRKRNTQYRTHLGDHEEQEHDTTRNRRSSDGAQRHSPALKPYGAYIIGEAGPGTVVRETLEVILGDLRGAGRRSLETLTGFETIYNACIAIHFPAKVPLRSPESGGRRPQ